MWRERNDSSSAALYESMEYSNKVTPSPAGTGTRSSRDTDAWLMVKLAADKKQGDLAMLLKSKADPNVAVGVEWREFATTPLFEACVSGHTRIARMLLTAGADVNQLVGPGYTALYNASFNGHADTVRLLTENGADVNSASHEHFSPLYISCQEGHTECAKALLRVGAQPNNARREEGATALYIASQNGHALCVESLIDSRATIDQPMLDGSTPLMIACYFRHVRVVELLLRAGASLTAKDNRGRTALEWAKKRNDALVVALVQEEIAARAAARKLRGESEEEEGGGGGGGGGSGGGGWFGWLFGDGQAAGGGFLRGLLFCLAPTASASAGASSSGDEVGSPGIGVGSRKASSALAGSQRAPWCQCCLPPKPASS